MKNKLTKHDEKVLATFLHRHRKDQALSLLQAKGFLFAVACCPELVPPSEWLEWVLEDSEFNDDREVSAIMNPLITLFNQIESQIVQGTAKLPKECRILPDTMRNFVDPGLAGTFEQKPTVINKSIY